MSKVIFLDFDGPMMPFRTYFMEGQTTPLPTLFDPVAVGMLNYLCQSTGAKIVLHTHRRKAFDARYYMENIRQHCIDQGLKEEHFHEDFECPYRLSSNRWHDIRFWLEEHPEVEAFVIFEDEECTEIGKDIREAHIPIDFNEGISLHDIEDAYRRLTGKPFPLFAA
jgi:hypothetical protein